MDTGVLSVDASPRDADVYLNGVHVAQKLPLRVTNRIPGAYNLRIEKIGYKSWEKNVDIKSRQTTYIKDIGLIKESLPVSLFLKNEKNIQSILPSSDGNYLLIISAQDQVNAIELYNTKTKEIQLISSFPLKTEYSVEWSPFDNSILIATKHETALSLMLLSAGNPKNSKTYEIQPGAGKNRFQWQKNAIIPALFTRDGNYLVKITINEYEKKYKISDYDNWYMDAKEKLWGGKGNRIFMVYSEEPKDEIIIPDGENINKIIDINEERGIIKSDKNIFVIPRDKEEKIETIEAESFIYNPGTKEWLAWSPWELWSIYEHGKPALLNRTGDNIISVFPLDAVGALLVVNKNGLTAFNPGYYVTQQLFNGKILGSSANQEIKTIYFLGKVAEKEGLFELEY